MTDENTAATPSPEATPAERYRLTDHVGFQLRRATQRHLAIFAANIDDLTPTQFAALARLAELGPQSQNALGRETAMDAATIKGVIDRLHNRGLVSVSRSETDRRRLNVELTQAGAERFAQAAVVAHAISEETLSPLAPSEQAVFLKLLSKLG